MFSLRRECDQQNRSEQRRNAVGTADQQDNTSMVIQQNNQETYTTSEQDIADHSCNGYEQKEGASEMIPVDDASPMTLSTLLSKCLQTLPDVGLSFNIKLAFLCSTTPLKYIQKDVHY